MGLFDKFKKKEKAESANTQTETSKERSSKEESSTLINDIPVYAEWTKSNLNKTGYKVDYRFRRRKKSGFPQSKLKFDKIAVHFPQPKTIAQRNKNKDIIWLLSARFPSLNPML